MVKAIGMILVFVGFLWALYGSVVTPIMYDPGSAPQAAQVNSEAARVAAGGLATGVLGVGLMVGSTTPAETKNEKADDEPDV